MALNTDPTSSLYSPKGVDFQDSLRIGAFSNKGLNTVGYGVQVGNTQAYSIQPQAYKIFISSVTVNNNSFLPLSNFDSTNGPTLIPGIGLKMDVPRLVQIICLTPSSTFSIRASYYDRYNQKAITEDTTSDAFYTSMGVNILTSLYLYNLSSDTLTFQVAQSQHFELPFTDNGNPQNLQSVNYNGQPQQFLVTNSVTPYGSRWGGNYFPTKLSNPNTLTPRPIFQARPDGLIDGTGILTFVQNIDNYGYKFNADPYQGNNFTYPNDQQKVTGVTPVNTNWQGWMG